MITAALLLTFSNFFLFLTGFLPTVTSLPYNIDGIVIASYSMIKAIVVIFPFIGLAMVYFLLGLAIQLYTKLFEFVNIFIGWIRG